MFVIDYFKSVVLLLSKSQLYIVLLLVICPIVQAQGADNQIVVTDSFGRHYFKQTPQRIVVLNWSSAGDLLALGLKPVGIADIEGYRKLFADKPPVSNDIVDVGSREAPDLKAIQALKPDLIIVGQSQRNLIRRLQNISKVLYFKQFDQRYHRLDIAEKNFDQLALLTKRRSYAKHLLEQRDQDIAKWREQLQQRIRLIPSVLLVRTASDRCCWLYTSNSMPEAALNALGINNAAPQKSRKYGVVETSLSKLVVSDATIVVLLQSNPSNTSIYQDRNWQRLVHDRRWVVVQGVNEFGGALSLADITQVIAKAVLGQYGLKSR